MPSDMVVCCGCQDPDAEDGMGVMMECKKMDGTDWECPVCNRIIRVYSRERRRTTMPEEDIQQVKSPAWFFREKTAAEPLDDIIREALTTDGGHHKQWYLEVIAQKLGFDLSDLDYERGIAP